MESADAHVPPVWCPAGVVPKKAPPEFRPEDLRWRPLRDPEAVPEAKHERTQKAVADQCLNARIPGYTGFVPGARAEDIYGRTAANTGRRAVGEHQRRETHRARSTSHVPSSPAESARGQALHASGPIEAPEEHPLGCSRIGMVRDHWVPTIPGYGGYIPAKHAENICGGGIIHTCKMAGRAIAERSRTQDFPAEETTQRSHAEEAFSHFGETGPHPVAAQRAANIAEHVERHIPGYTGHVPRVKGESLYGATFGRRNQIAGDLVQDRVWNPEEHARDCCNPQVPMARKLRL